MADKSEQNIFRIKREDAFCPFIRSPFEECFCLEMSSASIPLAIRYCQGHYRGCRIYRSKIESEEISAAKHAMPTQEHYTKGDKHET